MKDSAFPTTLIAINLKFSRRSSSHLRTPPRANTVRVTSPMTLPRSEEHTSELQSLMRISYAVFCLKKKTTTNKTHITTNIISDRCERQHNYEVDNIRTHN